MCQFVDEYFYSTIIESLTDKHRPPERPRQGLPRRRDRRALRVQGARIDVRVRFTSRAGFTTYDGLWALLDERINVSAVSQRLAEYPN